VVSDRLFAVAVEEPSGPSLALSFSTLGRIAELKAEVRLLELGHKVASPGVDEDGVDLVVDYRHAVQVKSSAGRVEDGRRWEFEFRAPRKDALRAASNAERSRSLRADFVLCYARDVDLWWVVPAADLRETFGRIRITPGGSLDLRWREAWHLLAA
jgi:hypothetical protein